MIFILILLTIIEIYYWFYWLPRNINKFPEGRRLSEGCKSLYGKNGVVWDNIKRGEL